MFIQNRGFFPRQLQSLSIVYYQNSALHLAAQEGRTNAVSFLLDSECALKLNHDSRMAMDFAIANANKDVALAMVANDRYVILYSINFEVKYSK